MQTISITDFEHWRNVARSAMHAGVAPEQIDLKENDGQQSLFGAIDDDQPLQPIRDDASSKPIPKPRVSKQLLTLAEKGRLSPRRRTVELAIQDCLANQYD